MAAPQLPAGAPATQRCMSARTKSTGSFLFGHPPKVPGVGLGEAAKLPSCQVAKGEALSDLLGMPTTALLCSSESETKGGDGNRLLSWNLPTLPT